MYKQRDEELLNVYKATGNTLELVSKLTNFDSFIYTEKKSKVNTMELVISPFVAGQDINLDFLTYLISIDFDVENHLLYIEDPNNPDRCGIITYLKLNTGAKRSDFKFEFKGYGLEYFLGTRVLAPATQLNSQGNWHFNKPLTEIVDDVVYELTAGHVTATANGGALVDTDKRLTLVNPIVDHVVTNDPNLSLDFRLKNGLEIMNSIFSALGDLNYYFYGTIEGGKIVYHLREGLDVSADIKLDNNIVSNVQNFEIEYDFNQVYNYASIAGQGEGALRDIAYYNDLSKANDLFKELYVNASDIESASELENRGKEKIEETKTSVNVSCDLIEGIGYKYGDEFQIADTVAILNILEIKNNITNQNIITYEQEFNFPIEEATHAYEGQYISTDIVLGTPKLMYSNLQLINQENNNIESRR